MCRYRSSPHINQEVMPSLDLNINYLYSSRISWICWPSRCWIQVYLSHMSNSTTNKYVVLVIRQHTAIGKIITTKWGDWFSFELNRGFDSKTWFHQHKTEGVVNVILFVDQVWRPTTMAMPTLKPPSRFTPSEQAISRFLSLSTCQKHSLRQINL